MNLSCFVFICSLVLNLLSPTLGASSFLGNEGTSEGTVAFEDKIKVPVSWDLWRDFKSIYLSEDGRVIDFYSSDNRTTSEGQSYALFFALVANDQDSFAMILRWINNNLANGDLEKRLPAWLWGKNQTNEWRVLDENSAADADMWLAYVLLEAGRIWHVQAYSHLGEKVLQLIKQHEITRVPGLGLMVLPGAIGFVNDKYWTFNPSYLPLQLITRFTEVDPDWHEIKVNSMRMLMETSPKGFSPDWVKWNGVTYRWELNADSNAIGGADAIRVYLWTGMLPDSDENRRSLEAHFMPIVSQTIDHGLPPNTVNTITGIISGMGPVGFSAALMPMMKDSPYEVVQLTRINSYSFGRYEYYNWVLMMFGMGWYNNVYHFNQKGYLVVT